MAESTYGTLNELQLGIRMLAGRIQGEFLRNFKRLNEEGRVKNAMKEQAGQWGVLLGRLDDMMKAVRNAGRKKLLKELGEERKLMARVYGLLTGGFPDENDREDLSAFLLSLIMGSTQDIPKNAKKLLGQ